jgi:hypothetical protein
MQTLILFLEVLGLAWLTRYYLRSRSLSAPKLASVALGLKLLAGVGLGMLYFDHYGSGDTISYWHDGVRIADLFRGDPIGSLTFFWDDSNLPDFTSLLQHQAPRSLFFSKFSGIAALMTLDTYWAMASVMSLLSFLGAWFLFRELEATWPSERNAAIIAVLFFPSVVFWSSGLIKESVGLASLYVLIALGLSANRGWTYGWKSIPLVLVALWIGWNLKYYWLGIFLPVAIPTLLVMMTINYRPAWRRYDLLLWTLLFALLLVGATNSHPNFYTSRFLEVICENNLEFTRLSDPPRLVQYLNLEPTVPSILLNAPAALIAGLFRPFVWEAFNTLSLLASLENLMLLLLVIQALPALRSVFGSPNRVFVLSALVYVLLLTTFLALSTPNFGTLSRYRIGAVPILVYLCLTSATPMGRWLGRRRWVG